MNVLTSRGIQALKTAVGAVEVPHCDQEGRFVVDEILINNIIKLESTNYGNAHVKY